MCQLPAMTVAEDGDFDQRRSFVPRGPKRTLGEVYLLWRDVLQKNAIF